MKLTVYDLTHDMRSGVAVFTKCGESDTWRGTHAFRRFTKESRTTPQTTPITSAVYDERGNFLCSP